MSAASQERDPIDVHPEAITAERGGHPLFPRSEHETGPERRRIDLIHIERLREDGTWETCPKAFKASEIRSWKDIVDLYGGGAYRARAQCAKTYQWQGTTERKEFAGPSKPFVEEPKRLAPQAAQAAYGPPPPAHGPITGAHTPSYGPPGWAPPAGWTPQSYHEPPPWAASLIKALERSAQPSQDANLIGLMFKAMADQNAIVFKMLAERQAAPPPAPATTPLEMIRELKPLLDSNTAPGQFMQGIEMAKSLLQQNAPAAPPQEDFATTLTGILRNFGGGGLLPGLGAPAAPAAPPPPPAPAPTAPALSMDDVIRMIASNRDLTQRFLQELGRRAGVPAAVPSSRPTHEPLAAPPPAATSGTSGASAGIAHEPPAYHAGPAPAPARAPTQPAMTPARPDNVRPVNHVAPAAAGIPPAAWSLDEHDAGTTVASAAPEPDDGGPGLEIPALDETQVRALLGSFFAMEPHGGAAPGNAPTGVVSTSTRHEAGEEPGASVLLALTGRQKGQA